MSIWHNSDPYVQEEFRHALNTRIQDVENREFWRAISRPQRKMVLERQMFFAREDVANHLLESATFDVIPMLKENCTRVLAKAMIPGKLKREEYTITEDPRYPSWKHQLVAGLPVLGFRRRFLERLWGINGNERTVVCHDITADTGFVFPECDYMYPDSLGRIRFMTDIKESSRQLPS